MNKPAFTPGPWDAEPISDGDFRITYGSKGNWLAEVFDDFDDNEPGRERTKADAHLIAAAPDMYEALLAAKVVIEMMERPEGMGGRVNAALDRRLAQIDAAIAKAEGRAA